MEVSAQLHPLDALPLKEKKKKSLSGPRGQFGLLE